MNTKWRRSSEAGFTSSSEARKTPKHKGGWESGSHKRTLRRLKGSSQPLSRWKDESQSIGKDIKVEELIDASAVGKFAAVARERIFRKEFIYKKRIQKEGPIAPIRRRGVKEETSLGTGLGKNRLVLRASAIDSPKELKGRFIYFSKTITWPYPAEKWQVRETDVRNQMEWEANMAGTLG